MNNIWPRVNFYDGIICLRIRFPITLAFMMSAWLNRSGMHTRERYPFGMLTTCFIAFGDNQTIPGLSRSSPLPAVSTLQWFRQQIPSLGELLLSQLWAQPTEPHFPSAGPSSFNNIVQAGTKGCQTQQLCCVCALKNRANLSPPLPAYGTAAALRS